MTASFYDQLAPFYHLLYGNWDDAVSRQGAAVLDAACGIGTQALGLVSQGYRVAASDISPGAVDRLRADVRVNDLRVYLTCELPTGACETRVLRSRYYAVTIDRLLALLGEAGFVDCQRRDDVLFQPVLWARRPP